MQKSIRRIGEERRKRDKRQGQSEGEKEKIIGTCPSLACF